MDFGRSMAYLGRAGWDNENTLEIQGERHLLLLQDMELIDGEHRLTPTGEQVRGELTLPVHMSLIDIAGQLNPGGPDAVRAAAEERVGAGRRPSSRGPRREPPEEDNGYHDGRPRRLARRRSEPSRPPIVPRIGRSRAGEPPPRRRLHPPEATARVASSVAPPRRRREDALASVRAGARPPRRSEPATRIRPPAPRAAGSAAP